MKYLILFLLSIVSTSVFSQNENEVDKTYSNYGEIPNWVKKKTTPEEYKIWETLSPHYQINYSYLKDRNLKGRAKAQYYKSLQVLCDSINSGNLPPKGAQLGQFFVVLDSLSAYSTRKTECIEKKCIIYSSLDGYDAHAELKFVYTIDSQGQVPHIMGWSVQGISFSGLEVTADEHIYEGEMKKYGSRLHYDKTRNMFKGYYCGRLSFTNAEGKEFQENISVNFYVMP